MLLHHMISTISALSSLIQLVCLFFQVTGFLPNDWFPYKSALPPNSACFLPDKLSSSDSLVSSLRRRRSPMAEPKLI